eukprot:4517856-Prymnesium_polylepis.1
MRGAAARAADRRGGRPCGGGGPATRGGEAKLTRSQSVAAGSERGRGVVLRRWQRRVGCGLASG